MSDQDKSCWNCRFAMGTRTALYCMINPAPVTGGACRNWRKIKPRDPEDCYWSECVQDMQANLICCRLREKSGDFGPIDWEDCDKCPEYHDKHRKIKGDLLRAMSDTELAEFMAKEARGCPPVKSRREACIEIFKQTGSCMTDEDLCEKCWAEFLRTPSVACGDTSLEEGGTPSVSYADTSLEEGGNSLRPSARPKTLREGAREVLR